MTAASVDAAPQLAETARELARLAQRAVELARSSAARERARRLRDHVEGHILPRVADIDAPLLVVLLGPTGAGKSSVLNTIAGSRASLTGALRPTTRDAVVYATEEDADRLLDEGRLARIDQARIRRVARSGAASGVVVIDAPDIDSIEQENRQLADVLLEAADLCVFVTTATRYADLVPYEVLRRTRERGLPLIVVLNRMPAAISDHDAVVADATRLLAHAGVDRGNTLLVSVAEGQRVPEHEALAREPLRPLLARIEQLSTEADERRRAAAGALRGAIRGLGPLARSLADDLEHDAADATALLDAVAAAYDEHLAALRRDLHEGGFLREHILREWHDFVGADQVTRLFARGLSRLRAVILSAFRAPAPAPIATVERETVSALEAVVLRHAGEAARLAAMRWSERRDAVDLIGQRAELWSASPSLASELRHRLQTWIYGIAEDVRAVGQSKRGLAQVSALGVNVVAVAVMLAIFAHTAGLTGAELGIAGATAFLNQKLLETIFGERAMEELVARARQRLQALLAEVFKRERRRFDALVAPPDALREVASALRAAASRVAT